MMLHMGSAKRLVQSVMASSHDASTTVPSAPARTPSTAARPATAP